MASTSASTQRVDPFLTFNFKVKWNNNYVASVSRVSGLTKTTQAVSFRSGGQPQTTYMIPGQTLYSPITLERGITFDHTFLQWANMTWYYPNTSAFGTEMSLATLRQNMQIELYNQAGQLTLRYNVYNCWPSEFQALPELDSSANIVALESLTLQNEGWDFDPTVTAPTLPSYHNPGS